MRTVSDDFLDELVAAIKASNPSEESVHEHLFGVLEPMLAESEDLDSPVALMYLGALTAAQFKYVDLHVRVPQHLVRQGKRPDVGGASKVAAVKSFAFMFYKKEVR